MPGWALGSNGALGLAMKSSSPNIGARAAGGCWSGRPERVVAPPTASWLRGRACGQASSGRGACGWRDKHARSRVMRVSTTALWVIAFDMVDHTPDSGAITCHDTEPRH
jgi:hypothetical protein